MKPTKKWYAALITGVAAIVASVVVSGQFGDAERGAVGALIVSLAGAFVKANDPTPGGVPE